METAHAGIYATIDMPEEIRWNKDYRAFERTLGMLKALAENDLKKGDDTPMRRRYLQIDAMGRDGTLMLKTLEQKLNYSAVLMRRGKANEATLVLHPLTVEQ